MAKYRVETTNGAYEVETDEAPPQQPGLMGQINQFSQEHPRLSSVASMLIPGASAVLDPTQETGKGALKQIGRDAYNLATSPALGPIGMGAGYLARKTGLDQKVMDATAPTNAKQEMGSYGTTAAEMALPIPAIGRIPGIQKAGTFMKAAATAAAPDVATGAGKVAAGLAADSVGVPYHVGSILGVRGGAPQIGRGLKAGIQAGREAIAVKPPPLPAPTAVSAPPAIFGDPQGFAKLPPNVQEAIMRGTPQGTPAARTPLPPRSMESYGVTPSEPAITTPKPQSSVDSLIGSLRQKVGIPEGGHLGEVPGAHYPERWAGSDSPTIRSTMAKTKFTKVNPEELGIHGGVEGTPIKGPLNTPEKIRIARELANAIKQGGK